MLGAAAERAEPRQWLDPSDTWLRGGTSKEGCGTIKASAESSAAAKACQTLNCSARAMIGSISNAAKPGAPRSAVLQR